MTYSRYNRRFVLRVRVFMICLIVFAIGFLCGHACAGTPDGIPQANAVEVEPPPFVIQITNEVEPVKPVEVPERETFNLYEHIAMGMTSEEMRLLEIILACEAQDEPYDGQ